MNRFNHILALMLLLGPVAVTGRVFRVVGVDGQLNTAGLPWEFAYQTTMDVNGRKNDLKVYSAHTTEPVVEQLKDQFEAQGAEVVIAETRDGAQGLARWEDREARILVLSGSDRPNQMVFLFYPEPGEVRAPAKLPVPEYPGGRSGNTVQNEGTGTICVTLETEDPPEQVQAFYAGALYADGWRTAIPTGSGASRMAVYRKKERICCILASYRPDGPNKVTLLVKGGGL
jgi:hypothetical protein